MNDAMMEIVLSAKDASAQGFQSVQKRLNDLTGGILSLKGALGTLAAGYGLQQLAEHAMQTAAGFERMGAKLDTVTKGQGLYTLESLKRWTADMPVMLQDVTDSFVTMQAMGLDPTEQMIRTLTDVSAVMGQDVFGRIVLQLGQMSTKGKVMAEDINILAEAGINARKYLQEAFGMGVDELQKSSIGISTIVREIFKGMERDFGGASERMAGTWDMMKVRALKSIEQIELGIMGAGVSDALKSMAADAIAAMTGWYKENEFFIKQNLPGYIKTVEEAIRGFASSVKYVYSEIGAEALEYGILGRILFGTWKPAALLMAVSLIDQKMKEAAESVGIRGSEKGLIGRTADNFMGVLNQANALATLVYNIFVKYPADFIRSVPEIQKGFRSFWTGALTPLGQARINAYPSETRYSQGYTGVSVFYDPANADKEYLRSQFNTTTDEARAAADRARAADQKMKSDKAISVQKKFAEDYKKEIDGVYEYEREKLAEQLKEFEEYIQDKIKLAQWYTAERRKIDIKEYAAGDMSDSDFRSLQELQADLRDTGWVDETKRASVQAWGSNRDALDTYRAELGRQRQAVADLDKKGNEERWWQTYVESTEDASRATEIFKSSMDEMAQSSANAFASFVTGSQSAGAAFQQMAQSILASLVRISQQKFAEQIFGAVAKGATSLFSGLFGGTTPTGMDTNTTFEGGQTMGYYNALVKHGGGSVDGGGASRSMPAWMFASAPRLHHGLAPDEFPAVLQAGERVIPKGQPAANVNVIVNNSTGAPVQTQERNGAGGLREILVFIGNDIASGGPIARAGETAYGWRRQGR